MKYDLLDLPGEIADIPACSNCGDDGVINLGSDVQSTTFCDCDEGEGAFEGMCDGQQAMEQDHGTGGEEW
tara:strand:- start:1279 stop:1488 length:210 start_codon:yes stop_codon:yes gene_type:complete